jgi:hypothetical protein
MIEDGNGKVESTLDLFNGSAPRVLPRQFLFPGKRPGKTPISIYIPITVLL